VDFRGIARRRPVAAYALITFALHVALACLTIQFNVDGDNTVSLVQANDWAWTPQRDYFWGQTYMGTTEVWLFSTLWRGVFGSRATIPLLYWALVAQALFVCGATLVYAGLVHADRETWTRRRTFVASIVVLGFAAPVFQKYAFGLGHGYSSTPLYAGLAVFLYLRRDSIPWGWWALAGLAFGQSHFVFRLHLVYPVALALAVLLTRSRADLARAVSLGLGTAAGMAPEMLWRPAQGYAMSVCAGRLHHVAANAKQLVVQLAAQIPTVPDGLLESEHALWFMLHRPLPGTWSAYGGVVGALLVMVLAAAQMRRDAASPRYRIFSLIFLVNFAIVAVSCIPLEGYAARRYLYPSAFAIVFFMLNPPWTIPQAMALSIRAAALATYVVSATAFSTPLARFAEVSVPAGFDVRLDCVAGSGGELSALMALNDLRARTIDLDWRLHGNYSRDGAPGEAADRCRNVFWIDAGHYPVRRLERWCRPEAPYFTGAVTGIVGYPQRVSFARCQLVRPH